MLGAQIAKIRALLRFRHFKRYYFSLAYDWERIDAIVERLQRAHRPLLHELEDFEKLVGTADR